MKITVIIPVYNVEKYLKKCIESVLAQSFTDYDIILVDDGSTDNSGTICDEYAQKHTCISVIHQENKGLGGARNTGIEASTGEYILFLDSDDYIHPDLLQICYLKAQEFNCDMVLFDSIATFEDGSLGVKYTCRSIDENKPASENSLKPLILTSSACNRLCKRELFADSKALFPHRLWYEDLHTMPKLVPYTKTVYYYTEKPLHYYLQRSTSIMHTVNFERVIKERLEAANEIWEFYREKGLWDSYKTELEFLRIFHAFFLPVREMQSLSKTFPRFADILREDLLQHCENIFENPYISTLSLKEQKMLALFFNRRYNTVKVLSALNKFLKRVKKLLHI